MTKPGYVTGFCTMIISATLAYAGNGPVVLPTGLAFGTQPVGTTSGVKSVTVFNPGSRSLTVNSVTPSLPQYQITSGTTPVTISPGQYANFTIQFAPDSAKSLNGKLTFTFSTAPPQNISLSGIGTSTTAIASLSATSLTFASQSLGTMSPAQSLTISNTGTSALKVTGVTVTYPFIQTGFTATKALKGGQSLTLQLTFFPVSVGSTQGTVLVTYDVLPSNGISLWATGAAATALGISTFPTLPSGTQNSSYQATLNAAGGIAPYGWQLVSGSSLPTGLALSGDGTITGSLASTVGTGNYTFTVQATDSSTPSAIATALLTLPMYAATAANCNNISFNAADGSGPLVPINDLGAGYYLNSAQGGLYANGSNARPSDHDSSGVSLAQGIQPLDSNGNPSPTGKYVFVAVGLSTAQQPFDQFVALANSDPSKNPNLVVVNGASGGATAKLLSDPNSFYWTAISNDYLPNAGVTANQVVAAWVNDVDGGPSGTFPNDMTNLQSELESIAQNLLVKFPNIKIAYHSSLNYTGYSNGVANLNPEPYAYEASFAVKNALQDQINGNTNLNFDPTKGTVLAPWLSWGPYYWANGMLPRADGLIWTCQDLKADGTHPSNPVGRTKVSRQLLNFFKTDDTATPWFLAPQPSNR